MCQMNKMHITPNRNDTYFVYSLHLKNFFYIFLIVKIRNHGR